jgi:hypothetical protein
MLTSTCAGCDDPVAYLVTGRMRRRADVLSGGSFASSNDPRVHFGLGDAIAVDYIEIH